MSKEAMGAFIDAVYAIAITILALEAPAQLAVDVQVSELVALVVEYALAFMILFSFWVQHRRLNRVPSQISRPQLWLHGIILLTGCLIPRATSLVFQYGGVGEWLHAPEVLAATNTRREMVVDLFYCGMIFAADTTLLMLMFVIWRDPDAERDNLIWRSKVISSCLLLTGLFAAMATSIQNRYFGAIIPVALLLEVELCSLMFRAVRPPATA